MASKTKRKQYFFFFFKMAIQILYRIQIYINTRMSKGTCVSIVFLHAKRKGNTLCAMAVNMYCLFPPPNFSESPANTRVLPGTLITSYLTCFYCYFQEHFFYFQEAELRMDVLQQHAALMGGASTTSCPLCHKLFLGSESLVEHMKVHHSDPTTVSQAVVQSEFRSREIPAYFR